MKYDLREGLPKGTTRSNLKVGDFLWSDKDKSVMQIVVCIGCHKTRCMGGVYPGKLVEVKYCCVCKPDINNIQHTDVFVNGEPIEK